MARGARGILGRVLGLLLLCALVLAAGAAFLHRQTISDHFKAMQFEPTERIELLADELDLTDAGELVFFASHPTIDGSQHFNEQCSQVDHSEQGHVLGCYSEESIHLFDVTDERLDGIVEVTGAHELLHAVHQRLSERERTRVNRQLRTAYEDLKEDHPEIEERMAVYEHLSKQAFANELHSVLGTELRDLPDALEDHYARWFNDRHALVDRFDSYHQVFEQLQARAEELQQEMLAIKEDVEQRTAAYDAAVEQFNVDADAFRARNEAFEFSDNPDEFYRLRDELEGRRVALEAEFASIQGEIDHYETLRTELKELSQTSDELDQLLDSELAPPATRPED